MSSHIMVQHPSSGEIAAFRMRELPFGAVRSVHAFLRVAPSLWYLLVKEFLVLTTNYFTSKNLLVKGYHFRLTQ